MHIVSKKRKNDSLPQTAVKFKRKLAVIALFLVLLALAPVLCKMVFFSEKNGETNDDIKEIAYRTEETTKPEKVANYKNINWNELKNINREIVGWIQINDTQVDYPVLHHEEDDSTSQFYLNHNYQGDYDSYGSIFIDYRCLKGTKSKNTIMHGHHMNDGSMFGELMKYGTTGGNLDFYKKSPTIEFDTPDGGGIYKIISVFKTNTLPAHGEFFNYMIGEFKNDRDFMNYVYNVRARSLIDCPVDINENDELITLSTCSYEFTDFRTVVVARKIRDDESDEVEVNKAKLNKEAVWPEVYYSEYGGTPPEVTDFITAYENGQIDWYSGNFDELKSHKIDKTVIRDNR